MTHLAISGNEDLSSGLVLTSVVIDIERIGDYAKNIYDLALRYPKKLKVESIEERVASIEDSSQSFFNNTIDAFKNQNIDLARELMSGYKEEISSISSEVVKDIISGKISDIDASEASAICLYVRYLKRISAHSRNLISSIVNPFERIGYPE